MAADLLLFYLRNIGPEELMCKIRNNFIPNQGYEGQFTWFTTMTIKFLARSLAKNQLSGTYNDMAEWLTSSAAKLEENFDFGFKVNIQCLFTANFHCF